jgi:hypothetical protein
MAFEVVSGIKMNLSKTELFPLNTDQGSNFASIFRCKLGKFPLRYLGLPLSDVGLKKQDWDFLLTKFEKRLQGCKGNMLSIGGQLTLLNSVLSSIPLYTLSIYKISQTVLDQIDKIRRRFLWQGADGSKKKYFLVNWYRACLAKEFGGLGILDLKQMNIALMLKW